MKDFMILKFHPRRCFGYEQQMNVNEFNVENSQNFKLNNSFCGNAKKLLFNKSTCPFAPVVVTLGRESRFSLAC